jgi:hypothetical protein
MGSVYFSRRGMVSIEFIPNGQTYDSEFFVDKVLPSIERNFARTRPEMRATGVHLHLDNAKPHTARKSVNKMHKLGLIRVPQPPYSPHIVPCDFFLFGHLKDKLAGNTFICDDAVIAVVTAILKDIPIKTLCNVIDEWKTRLNQLIQCSGEYLPSVKEEI